MPVPAGTAWLMVLHIVPASASHPLQGRGGRNLDADTRLPGPDDTFEAL